MSEILQFPTEEDRENIHALIYSYALGQMSRNELMHKVADIVLKYPRLGRIPVYGYTVRVLDYYGELPIISIEGAQLVDRCPCCEYGTDHARYLRTEKENFDREFDIVSVTCLECGCVYAAKGVNGRRNSGEKSADRPGK